MTLIFFVNLVRGHMAMENTFTQVCNLVPGVFLISFFGFDEIVVNQNSEAVTGISSGQVSVVGDIPRSKRQAAVEDAENRQIRGFQPVDLSVHTLPVNGYRLYMTGLYSPSNVIGLHTLRYREVDISSWPPDIVNNDHALGSTRVQNEKSPGLPRQREPGVWSGIRMYTFDSNREKSPGLIAAQTPSTRPHRSILAGVFGASALGTATNHARTVSLFTGGGGRRVEV